MAFPSDCCRCPRLADFEVRNAESDYQLHSINKL
jgi:hypothetical protein